MQLHIDLNINIQIEQTNTTVQGLTDIQTDAKSQAVVSSRA